MELDNKKTLYLVSILFISSLFLSAVGISESPLKHYFSGDTSLNQRIIAFGFLFTQALIGFLLSRPNKEKLYSTIAAGSILSIAHYLFLVSTGADSPFLLLICIPLCYLGVSSFIAMSYGALNANNVVNHHKYSKILIAFFILFIFGSAGGILLKASSILSPYIYDYELFKIEASLGFQPSYLIGTLVHQHDHLKNILTFAYITLSYGFIAVYSYSVSNKINLPFNILKAMLTSSAMVFIAYNFLPVVGPKFSFSGDFPFDIPNIESFSQGLPILQSFSFRNGMPSMHVGWAILLWLISKQLKNIWIERFFAVFLGLTIFATLGLGEHFLTDLVVAAPFIIACLALATDTLPWTNQTKQRTIFYGFGIWFIWILAIRYTPALLKIPGSLIICYVTTLWASSRIYRGLINEIKNNHFVDSIDAEHTQTSMPTLKYPIFLFALSGFAALTYEVVISKQLASVFGSMATATYTVLITYMGGLAAGSWFGGKFATKINRPLFTYAVLELCIGIFFIASPLIFDLIKDLYIQVGKGSNPESSLLLSLRISLGAVVLFIPTFLMGTTFPVLIKHFNGHNTLGVSLSKLYSANTLGAAFGSLATGYLVLPFLGASKTLLLAVTINFIVALFALHLFKKNSVADNIVQNRSKERLNPPVSNETSISFSTIVFSGLVLFVIGAVSFGLETSYIQLLSVVAGNSAYAFSLMLFAFLLGIGIGALIAQYLIKLSLNRTTILGFLILGLASTALVGLLYWDSLPQKFSAYQHMNISLGFGTREFIRAFYCLVAMLPPAIIIGAIFPIASELFAEARRSQLKWVGISSAINTLGNILGVLVTGFYLIPTFGTNTSVKVFAVICILLVTTGILLRAIKITPAIVSAGLASIALFSVIPDSFDYDKLASGANVYFSAGHSQNVIAHAESIDGGLTTVSSKEINGQTVKTLLTNGKFQGNNAMDGEMIAQYGFSLAPLLHLSNKQEALIIGFGTGVSAKALYNSEFGNIDVAELSKDIVQYADFHFSNVNDHVARKNNVNIHYTDGRNMLLLSNKQYDFIGLEITSIWFAGASSLYNQEFYQLAKNHLTDNGVLQQWVQLHHIHPEDILYIIGTVRKEFANVWLYVIGGQGVIIASNSDEAYPSLAREKSINQNKKLVHELASFGGNAKGISDKLMLTPTDTDKYLSSFGVSADYWVSTDDNLFLEYNTPKGNALDATLSVENNMGVLTKYSSVFTNKTVVVNMKTPPIDSSNE